MRGLLFGVLLLGCSAGGGNGAPSDPNHGGTAGTGGFEQVGDAGSGGEPTAGTSGGGSGGSAAGNGGKPNETGGTSGAGTGGTSGGSAGASGSAGAGGGEPEPWLGSPCTIGSAAEQCSLNPEVPSSRSPICMPVDGMVGGEQGRPGYCTFTCEDVTTEAEFCEQHGGNCNPPPNPSGSGEWVVDHCVPGN
jgi:hypothetical protein